MYGSANEVLTLYLPVWIIDEIFEYMGCRGRWFFADKIKWRNFDSIDLKLVILHCDGRVSELHRYSVRYKELHSIDDLPAYVKYYSNGLIFQERWFYAGQYHRRCNAAVREYNRKGRIALEVWYEHGIQHRVDGPAEIYYANDGNIIKEIWYNNGVEMNV